MFSVNGSCLARLFMVVCGLTAISACASSAKHVSLHGVVIDSVTGSPIEGKEVVLKMFEPSYVPLSVSSFKEIGRTTTSGEGAFQFNVDVTNDLQIRTKECGLIGGGEQNVDYESIKDGEEINLEIVHERMSCRPKQSL